MKYQKEMKFLVKNHLILKRLAEKQIDIINEQGNNDLNELGFLYFDFDDIISIFNPFDTVCMRDEVNPVAYYGEAFLKSGWTKGEAVENALKAVGLDELLGELEYERHLGKKVYENDSHFNGHVELEGKLNSSNIVDCIVTVKSFDGVSFVWEVSIERYITNLDEILEELKKDKYVNKGASETI